MPHDCFSSIDSRTLAAFRRGIAIPAHPLALTSRRTLDERRQRALARYYIAAGSGGLAVGVHTTQFQIRNPEIGLFLPVLTIAREEMDRADAKRPVPLMRIGGVTGPTDRACNEAALLRELGYHAGLLSLAALPNASDESLIEHCRAVGKVIPIIGFYLQPRVGGRELSYEFWHCFTELDSVLAIKIAPFDRYRTLDVVRAVMASGRDDIALYTGNDDNIVHDLITPYRLNVQGKWTERRIVGGLLGHWSVWTRRAVELLERCQQAVAANNIPPALLVDAIQVTDSNAAFFDAANGFKGVIAGLHEVLRRQGLLEGIWCLDEHETLGPGQIEEIDRVLTAYPHLSDNEFVAQHRSEWFSN